MANIVERVNVFVPELPTVLGFCVLKAGSFRKVDSPHLRSMCLEMPTALHRIALDTQDGNRWAAHDLRE